MKPLSISTLLPSSMLAFLLAVAGCAGNGGPTSSTTTTATTGGSGGAGGSGGGPSIDYPPCQDNQGVFIGVLDGQPFDKTIPTDSYSLDQGSDPPYVSLYYVGSGELHLIWKGLAEPNKPKATTGYFLLPGEMVKRDVLPGSSVIVETDRRFRVELFMDQGHLIGCSRSLF